MSTVLNHLASELMKTCSCPLSAKYLANADLSCSASSTDRVILTASLVGTQERHGAELHSLLQQWVNDRQMIQVQGVPLEVIVCSTYPGFAATCSNTPTTTLNSPTPNTSIIKISDKTSSQYIGGTFGAVAFLCIVIIIVVVMVVLYKRHSMRTNR